LVVTRFVVGRIAGLSPLVDVREVLMRGAVKISLVLLPVLVVAGLLVSAIAKARHTADMTKCRNNLKCIAVALHSFQEIRGHYPTGTFPSETLPPDKRFSWVIEVWPDYMCGGMQSIFDLRKTWDAAENCPPWARFCLDKERPLYKTELWGELKLFHCPSNASRSTPELPSPTDYVGIAGVGETAAELLLSDPKAGFFGHDRKVKVEDVKNGTSRTVAIAETPDGGPWTAGGWATVRGLVPDGMPYVGEGGQFKSRHRAGGGAFFRSGPVVTHMAFADGSIRPFTASATPHVVEALAVLAASKVARGFDQE
jgi:hypothetical protein